MSDNNNNNDNNAEDFKKKLEALKPKKKKLDVAEGLLDGAKSYDGKLLAVKIIADRELKRTVLLVKGMIAQGREDSIRLEAEKERAKKLADAKAEAEKKAKLEAAKKTKGSMLGKFKGKK
jgi:regulator of protease activity HflC (stomatin/prohibitin superfamily)